MNIGPNWIVDYAEEVKKVVNIPVMTVGRINDPFFAESILLSGKADLVSMGRASLADPELPNKFAQGRYEDIRHCIGCQQGCLEILFKNEPIRCLVNPTLGFEYLDELKKTNQPKNVTVVGGGPAGMEAARAAALVGHQVTLYERTDRLGGQFITAAISPGKGDFTSFTAWAARQVEKLDISIKLNTEYSAAICDKEKPDLVIIATGSYPSKPSIPGIEGANVVTAEDILLGKVSAGQKVIIAGGGMVGCETALYLATLGKQVTIVEMLPMIAEDEEFTRRILLMKDIEDNHIEVVTNAELKEINEKGVQLKKDQTTMSVEADMIVLALGMTSENTLQQELEGKVAVKTVGDALTSRNALEAVREGFLAGAQA